MSEAPRSGHIELPRIILLAALAVALLALGLYLRTLHPGVGPSLDSMELQTAVVTDGVIHPPGSPQYLLLGKMITFILPISSPAYRLNLMSAIFAAATISIAYLLTYRLTRRMSISIFSSLLLAVAPRIWYQASIAELYTLNAFYVILTLYLLITWHQTGKPAAYWATIVVYAFSFGNHLSMILLLPVFLYVVQITDRRMFLKPTHLAITAGIVLLAALQYAIIPLRTAANPAFCNYCPASAQAGLTFSPAALIDYLTGGPFKEAMFNLPRREILARLPDFAGLITRQFMPWGAGLAIVGIWEMFQRRADMAWALVLGIVAESIFVLSYDIPDWHDFLTPVYVLCVPLIGYGAHRLWQILRPHVKSLLIQGKTIQGHIIQAGLFVLMALGLLLNFFTYLPLVDQRSETAYEINSRALLAQAEPGAWVIMPHPSSTAFYYSWAVRYTSLAEDLPADLSLITPVEINPPPGPDPVYVRWDDISEQLTTANWPQSGQQVFILDWADERFEDWGLLPACVPDSETIAGYEVVALRNGEDVVPLVGGSRWAAIEDDVQFSGSEFYCP